MTDELAAPTKISFLRGLSGVLLATLFYLIGSIIAAVIASFPVFIAGLTDNLIAQTVQSVIVTAAGMWFSRSATDWTLKRYSGRAVFVVFLSLMLITATVFAVRLPFNAKVGASFVQLVTTCGAAYYWFWRRESETPEIIMSRVENGKAIASTMLGCLPMVLFLVFGLIQYSAISAQVQSVTHSNGWLSGALTWLLTYLPIVGSIVGFFGAKDVWGWQWWQAALLYFGMPVGFYVLYAIGGATNAMIQRTRRPPATGGGVR